jgi:single-stranded-DNA-specific exonuclease
MSLGIECLVTDDPVRALRIARELDALNRQRREIEACMQEAALAKLGNDPGDSFTLTPFDPQWHQGVIGIVASRLKERFHRPVIAFARGQAGEIKGSGRSIAALHLRDALDLVTKRFPGLVLKFGGHAAAAGLTLRECDLDLFANAFEETARSLLTTADLQREIETDGSLEENELTFEAASTLGAAVWGHGFPQPQFFDGFEVVDQRTVGAAHLRLRLGRGGRAYDAMLFRESQPLPRHIEAIYRMDVNEFNGTLGLQLTLQHWRPKL